MSPTAGQDAMVKVKQRRLRRLMKMPIYDKANAFGVLLWRIKSFLLYRRVFSCFGEGSYIERPELISNPRFMRIGDRVSIRKGVRLECVCDPYGRIPVLTIGSNVNIEQDVHIVCHSRVSIGNDVSITGRCAIVDVTHPYDVIAAGKIGSRIVDEDSFVEICEGAFIGFGSVILPNVRIGKCAVIGANSVVTRDVPDYSVAVGAPAHTIRKYSNELGKWLSQSELDTKSEED